MKITVTLGNKSYVVETKSENESSVRFAAKSLNTQFDTYLQKGFDADRAMAFTALTAVTEVIYRQRNGVIQITDENHKQIKQIETRLNETLKLLDGIS